MYIVYVKNKIDFLQKIFKYGSHEIVEKSEVSFINYKAG